MWTRCVGSVWGQETVGNRGTNTLIYNFSAVGSRPARWPVIALVTADEATPRPPTLQSLLMTNPHNFSVEYEWELSSSAFAATSASGTIKPKSTAEAVVRWRPAAAPPPPADGKGAKGAASEAGKPAGGKGATAAPSAGKASSSKQGTPAEAGSGAGGGNAAAAAAAPGESLMQTGVVTLRLTGGADVPQRVALVGELPGGCLKPREKEVSLGAVPVGEPQTATLTLRNTGSREAAFRVSGRWLPV